MAGMAAGEFNLLALLLALLVQKYLLYEYNSTKNDAVEYGVLWRAWWLYQRFCTFVSFGTFVAV
jgi:hypothetical protein